MIITLLMVFKPKMFIIFAILFNCITAENIYIGGLFDENAEHEKAFSYAVEKANDVINHPDITLVPLVENLKPNEPFFSAIQTCTLLDSAVVGVFGPTSLENINSVQSVCDEKEIPHIIFRWNHNHLRTGSMLNLYPHSSMLSRVYLDIIKAWEWKTFTVLYENNESLIRLGELIISAKELGITVVVRQLDKYQRGSYREILKQVKKSEQKHFVIDCQIEHLKEVLLQVQQVGLMNDGYHYFLTNLDAHTEDLTSFQYSETNITGIRLINPEKTYVQEIAAELFEDNDNIMFVGPMAAWRLRTETALIVDAVQMFAHALVDVLGDRPQFHRNYQCNSSESWEHGYSVINLMKTSSYMGLTGLTQFNHKGYRSEFQLDVYELKEGGIANVGVWNSSYGINITRIYNVEYTLDENSLRNKSFIVITALTDPYGMLKETEVPLYGNDRYEGFGIDLIHQLSLMEGFNYTFTIRQDKKNGEKNLETGKWSGMIGDLMDYRADLAITDLTITSERAEAVDFTTPFMNLGISILFRKPEKAPPNFFSFAEPFALETWIMLGLAFFVVSISLYIMGRLCPEEWTNPYPCIDEPEYLVNQFSLQNSFWFTVGSLMQQGTEIAPIAISTRMTAGMWWFFVLIIIASYTANLAAFLATENPIELFKDVNSLVANAEQFGIRYGAKAGGATANFFRDSNNPTYMTIAAHMKNHKEDMVKQNEDGVSLAEKEPYAFFMESTSIEYATQRHCDLIKYGNLLDNKGYGIAMRKNSPYRHKLTTAILKLQSSGEIENLKRKWWEERRGGGACAGESDSQDATPLNLMNVEGVFYVTIGGVICAIIMVILELLIYVHNTSKKRKTSFKEAFKMEMKYYTNFDSNVKPAPGRASSVSKSKSKSKSKSVSSSPDEAKMMNKERPYGFVVGPSMERLTTKSSS